MTLSELKLILPAILGERDYIVIRNDLAALLASVDGAERLVHAENDSDTVNWRCERLDNCAVGTVRLWNITDWRTADNVTRKARVEAERERAERNAASEALEADRGIIIDCLQRTGLQTAAIERNVLANMDREQVAKFAAELKRGKQ